MTFEEMDGFINRRVRSRMTGLVDYWDVATRALILAGVAPERAADVAWKGIKLALEAGIGEGGSSDARRPG